MISLETSIMIREAQAASKAIPPKPLDLQKIISKEWNPTAKKSGGLLSWVASGAKLFFASLVAIPVKPIHWLYRKGVKLIGSSSARKELKRAFKAAFEKQFKGLSYVKSDRAIFLRAKNAPHRAAFEAAVEKFSAELPVLAKNPGELRKRLALLTKHPVYLEIKNSNHPIVTFLQNCGEALESTPGTDVFSTYGKAKIDTRLPQGQPTLTLTEYADGIEKARDNKTINRDGKLATLVWGATHLQKLAHVEYAHLNPLDYDSYQGQMVFIGDPFVDTDDAGVERRIDHKYTPGLTGPNSIVENVLIPAYRKQGRRWVHIDNQSTHTTDERKRINEVHRMAQENPDVLQHAVISTDTPLVVAKKIIKKFENDKNPNIALFIDQYEQVICGPNYSHIRDFDQTRGIHIPDTLLNDEELEAAFATAREMVLDCQATNAELLKTPEGRQQLVAVITRNINSTLSFAIMKKEQMSYVNSTFTENCKENIDRGPPKNEEIKRNDALSRGITTIEREETHRSTGHLLARAERAMDRSPQEKRFDPFLERLRYIDSSDETRAVAVRHLQNLRSRFTQRIAAAPVA